MDYYSRKEVSNSDLTALKEYLEGNVRDMNALTNIFFFGNLFDAMLTEKEKVDFRRMTFNGEFVDPQLFKKAEKMKLSFMKDPFARYIATESETQTVIVTDVDLSFNGYPFKLPMRCKLDFYLRNSDLACDLKSTSSSTQEQFESAVDKFDYDRQSAVYMTLTGVNRFAIIGVSKRNMKLFKVLITKESDLYKSGMEKFTELAFKWWSLFC